MKPSDPLLFICKIYAAALLRLVLPTGDQEIISIGDTAADIALPPGFTAVSLDITENDDFSRHFHLRLSIDGAFRLNDGNITCDDTARKEAEAGCPISKPSSPLIVHYTINEIKCCFFIGDKMHVSICYTNQKKIANNKYYDNELTARACTP